MAAHARPSSTPAESFPGQQLGLPAEGRGSLAPWRSRVVSLVVDWAASMAVTALLFGSGLLTDERWRAWTTLAVYFIQSTVLGALTGGSLGQLIVRLGIARLDHRPLGFVRSMLRAAMVCMVLPALVIGPDRRGLHDVAVGTVVINRR